jgi:hypothetical protein
MHFSVATNILNIYLGDLVMLLIHLCLMALVALHLQLVSLLPLYSMGTKMVYFLRRHATNIVRYPSYMNPSELMLG